MRIVVTDTSPLNYLVQMGCGDMLGSMFDSVIVPEAVMRELCHPNAPESVRLWAATVPGWVMVKGCEREPPALGLDPGETEAIGLALELGIETVIMDERKGRRAAAQLGLISIGTLTLLEMGDDMGLLDYESMLQRLRECGFHVGEDLIAASYQRVQRHREAKSNA